MASPGHFQSLQEFARTTSREAAQKGGAERLSKLSRRLHVLADSEIAKAQGQSSVACTTGCCHCCYGVIRATLPELVEIATAVREWSEEDRAGLAARANTHAEQAKEYWRYDTDTFPAPCPFLVESRCSIYANRPLACRGANSDDPQGCEQIRLGTPVRVGRCAGQDALAFGLTSANVIGLAEGGSASGTYDLAASLRILLANPDWEERVLNRGDDLLSHTKLQTEPGAPERPNEWERPFRQPEFQALWQAAPSQAKFDALTRMSARNGLAALNRVFLPPFYESEDARLEWLARFETSVDEALSLDVPPRLGFESLYFGGLETFYLPYAGIDVKPLRERIMGHAYHRYAVPAFPELTAPLEGPRKPGRFRLGYISLSLGASNGSRWALGWLTEQSPEIETFAFHLGMTEDPVTFRWRRHADHYYHLPYSAPAIAAFVRSLNLDAIIFTDIGSETITLQLSLLRLARFQCAAWGIPCTSGSPAIDAYLGCADMEPINGQDHYTEKLIRLSGSSATYPRARGRASLKSAVELGLPSSGFSLITQNAIKLLPSRDAIYREISERTGKPIVICRPIPASVGDAVLNRMRRAGVNVIGLPRMTVEDYLRVIQLADCVLDSFDFGGGITTIDTLTLGKPVITCPGQFMRSRLSLPFLRQCGAEGLITETPEDYIRLACDLDGVAAVMENHDPEPMFRDLRPLRELETLLLSRNSHECGHL